MLTVSKRGGYQTLSMETQLLLYPSPSDSRHCHCHFRKDTEGLILQAAQWASLLPKHSLNGSGFDSGSGLAAC